MEELAKEHGLCGNMLDPRWTAARAVLQTGEQQTVGPAARSVVFASAGSRRPAIPSIDATDARDVPARRHSEAVHGEIFRALPRGEPTVETVAQALALSPRTLSRRLAEEGTTFRQALADLRRGLAIQYVEATGLGVDQIAMLLGYGNAAAFRNAFRRWTGASVSGARQVRSATMA